MGGDGVGGGWEGFHGDGLLRWLSGDDSRVKKMEGRWFAYSAGRVLEESVPPAELAGPAGSWLKLTLLEGHCIFMIVVVLKCVVIIYIIKWRHSSASARSTEVTPS